MYSKQISYLSWYYAVMSWFSDDDKFDVDDNCDGGDKNDSNDGDSDTMMVLVK